MKMVVPLAGMMVERMVAEMAVRSVVKWAE